MRGYEIRTDTGLFYTPNSAIALTARRNGQHVAECRIRKLADGTYTRRYR